MKLLSSFSEAWFERDSTMINRENRACGSRFDCIRVFLLIALSISSGCQTNNEYAVMPPSLDSGAVSEVIQISRELDKQKYAGIVSAIDFHAGDYPIRDTVSHKGFSDNLLKEYLDNLETVGVLVNDKKVSQGRAYEELGFVIEKAWCNNDVRKYVDDSRKSDNISSDAKNSYSAFEEFARYCLIKDNKTCSDVDKEQMIEQK